VNPMDALQFYVGRWSCLERKAIGLRLEASVPGMDEATFQKIAAKAKQDCPLSKALASVPEITLTAILR
jgi:organic hydroperoxide reductase OsmC/OhrA